jgi:transcriptional regulator with XRE-family HTH domain
MPEETPLGKRLKSLREIRGLSIRDAARGIRISHMYLWKLENRPDANPSLEVMQRLSSFYDVSIGQLAQAGETEDDQLRRRYSEALEGLKQAHARSHAISGTIDEMKEVIELWKVVQKQRRKGKRRGGADKATERRAK